MADKPTTLSVSSRSDLRKNVPVVTVESFYHAHGEKLHLKLEGKRLGFHRKIREPTINRPGLALRASKITSPENASRFWARPSNPISTVFRPRHGPSGFAASVPRRFLAWSFRVARIWSRRSSL